MILFVSGFQRCGSSLMMQMLAAGGMSVVHDSEMGFPSYETHLNMTGEPLGSYDGHALKWLEPCHSMPPEVPFEIRSIWLTRDHWQQAKSAVKFMRACGVPNVRSSDAGRFKTSYDRDEPRSVKLWRKRGDCRIVRFEDLVKDAAWVAERVNEFIGGALDLAAMMRQIRPRSAKCLDYLLEEELMAYGKIL